MSEQQNTQQPVARISLHRVDGVPRATLLQTLGGAAVLPIGEIDVYAAPVAAANDPVPRDVLMALGEAVRDAWLEYDDGKRFTINIAEIADRHASQVQPEPVNQQMLAALERLLECYKMADHSDGYCCCGSPIATHDDPMNCGHCATDAGEYNAGLIIKDMEAAIASVKGGAAC